MTGRPDTIVKRVAAWLVSAALIPLMWAALDDITTGSEPSHRLEWTLVALGLAWFLGLMVLRLARRPR